MIDISFGQYMATLTSFPVQQDTISQDDTENRVWFRRESQNTELMFSVGQMGLTETVFSVEITSLDIDSCQNECNAIKAALHGFLGTMIDDYILLCTVEDASDDYTPKSLGDDTGLYLCAFNAKLIQS